MTDESTLVKRALDLLRGADANLRGRGRPNWEAQRRLAVVAACCLNRAPLLEAMNTKPPCVLTATAKPVTTSAERKHWQMGNGKPEIVWLSTFEAMAGTNLRYWLWCPTSPLVCVGG